MASAVTTLIRRPFRRRPYVFSKGIKTIQRRLDIVRVAPIAGLFLFISPILYRLSSQEYHIPLKVARPDERLGEECRKINRNGKNDAIR